MSDTEQKIRDLLQNIAKEQNFENYDIKVSPVSTEGGNYTSVLHIATISGESKDDLHLFIKVASLSKEMREAMKMNIYELEKVVYTAIKHAYNEIEKKHQVPAEHCLYIPRYYGSISTPFEEILVLENLAAKGFVTHDRLTSMDWEYASKAVTELAKLHSLSIAFQREYPEEFKRIKDEYIIDSLSEDNLMPMWHNGVKHALKALTDENKKQFKMFSDKFNFDTLKKNYAPLRVEVITHSDYKPNNLMHRTLQNGSLELVAIDHQTVQIGSPVSDLLYLIFIGTDKEFRYKYYENLLDVYYTQLSDAMKRLGINPEKTYSREDFYFEVKEKLLHGLVSAVYALPFITVEPEKAPNTSGDMNFEMFSVTETSAVYSDMINGVVSDFIRWGVLTD